MRERPRLRLAWAIASTGALLFAAGMWVSSLFVNDLVSFRHGRSHAAAANVRHMLILELGRSPADVRIGEGARGWRWWRLPPHSRLSLREFALRHDDRRFHVAALGFAVHVGRPTLIRGPGPVVGFIVPWWSLVLVSLVGPTWWVIRRRSAHGRAPCCERCGYDLRASGHACPECGHERRPAHRHD